MRKNPYSCQNNYDCSHCDSYRLLSGVCFYMDEEIAICREHIRDDPRLQQFAIDPH